MSKSIKSIFEIVDGISPVEDLYHVPNTDYIVQTYKTEDGTFLRVFKNDEQVTKEANEKFFNNYVSAKVAMEIGLWLQEKEATNVR